MIVGGYVTFILIAVVAGSTAEHSDVCKINVKNQKRSVQPLLLEPSTNQFLYPKPVQNVEVNVGQKIGLACPGENNSFTLGKPEKTEQEITPECLKNDKFKLGNETYPFTKLTCRKRVEATAVLSGRCSNSNYSRIKIGFNLKDYFVTTVDLCFDQDNYEPIYSSFKLTPSVIYRQFSIFRPDFDPSIFYDKIDIALLYKRQVQRQTLAKILGSEKLARKYIRFGFFNFIARGHLSAMADFVYSTEQRSTFFYVNTAPQWQLFNAGNWVALEKSVRGFANDRKSELVVVTGTWGVCSLPDVNGELQPLHLYVDENNNRAVRVPGYFWKIVYDPASKEGVAFVGINNPHLTNVSRDQIFCKDICDRFNWVPKSRYELKKGYLFCCSVDDFRATVTTAPEFQVDFIFS